MAGDSSVAALSGGTTFGKGARSLSAALLHAPRASTAARTQNAAPSAGRPTARSTRCFDICSPSPGAALCPASSLIESLGRNDALFRRSLSAVTVGMRAPLAGGATAAAVGLAVADESVLRTLHVAIASRMGTGRALRHHRLLAPRYSSFCRV